MVRKKDEDLSSGGTGGLDEFLKIDKSTVLQECRVFNETPIKPRRCCLILTKLIALITSGESISNTEATDAFFSVTKLFQSSDPSLRRLVYLSIKELSALSENVIMATSSLMKDMNSKSELMHRANSLRALRKITDSSMMQGIERFFKQAIVDRSSGVASAALVSSYHLFQDNKEVVKRWVNEVQEALNSSNASVQYHAIGLMYLIRQHDKMAVSKFVTHFSKAPLRSPYAYVMIIRYAVKVMEEEQDENQKLSFFRMIEGCLRHGNDMVALEAARSICEMKDVNGKELYSAVAVLQAHLGSPRIAVRLGAIRTLSKLAMKNPITVATCNVDLEALVNDSNRSIATYAITTLLKTGTEASVDRLMKQINTFFSEISDEFKAIIIEAIRSLCLKFPTKHSSMLTFLSSVLRDEGGYEFKKAVVDSIFDIVYNIPESKDAALSHLCEFIEDCEFVKLTVRILHIIGEEGPFLPGPSKYIRHIYNRIILETASVRAAAIDALIKFSEALDSLKPSIVSLLKSCLFDLDDEVRDRVVLYLKSLEYQAPFSSVYKFDSYYSFQTLELKLLDYLNSDGKDSPFDMHQIPLITKAQEEAEKEYAKVLAEKAAADSSLISSSGRGIASSGSATKTETAEDVMAKRTATLAKVPQLAAFGNVLKSSSPYPLTESETEYVVNCIKHIYKEHVVFQFNCRNTLNDQVLEKVRVNMETDSTELRMILSHPIELLDFDAPDDCFVVFKTKTSFPTAAFSNTLKFAVKEKDPSSGEIDSNAYDDEYNIEQIEISLCDFVNPLVLNGSKFAKTWDELGSGNEVVDTFQLSSMRSIQEAIDTVIEVLGMTSLDNSSQANKTSVSHTLVLSGLFVSGERSLVRCRMVYEASSGVTMEMTIRSDDAAISQAIAEVIG